jgi:hypothetical protein
VFEPAKPSQPEPAKAPEPVSVFEPAKASEPRSVFEPAKTPESANAPPFAEPVTSSGFPDPVHTPPESAKPAAETPEPAPSEGPAAPAEVPVPAPVAPPAPAGSPAPAFSDADDDTSPIPVIRADTPPPVSSSPQPSPPLPPLPEAESPGAPAPAAASDRTSPEGVYRPGHAEPPGAHTQEKIEAIKDLYLTAEAIGDEALGQHFEQLSQRQRSLIREFFEKAGLGASRKSKPRNSDSAQDNAPLAG